MFLYHVTSNLFVYRCNTRQDRETRKGVCVLICDSRIKLLFLHECKVIYTSNIAIDYADDLQHCPRKETSSRKIRRQNL